MGTMGYIKDWFAVTTLYLMSDVEVFRIVKFAMGLYRNNGRNLLSVDLEP